MFKDLKTFWKRRISKEAVEEDDDKGFAGNSQDNNPGRQVLNGGEHGAVFGINRKIVSAVMVGIVLVIGMATLFNINDKKETGENKQPQAQVGGETPTNLDMHGKDKKEAASYDDLFKQQTAKTGQQGQGGNPQNANNANNANRPGATGGNPQQAVQAQPRPASVPAIQAAPVYSPPVALPSQQAAASSAKSAEEKAEEKRQKSLEERFASAIDFALGRSGSNNQGSDEASGQVRQLANASGNSGIAQVSYSAPSDTVLQAGTVIPAMLFSGINSDIPGQVTAQVQADVYDTATGSRLLIPAGSTLIGSYGDDSQGGVGSAASGRVGLTFTTIVLPDGGAFSVGDSLVAVDGAGFNGLAGKVNHHTGSKLGGGMFATALAALGSYASGNVNTGTTTYSGGQLAMQGAMANLMNSASSLFKEATKRENTVTVQPGYEFNVYVTKAISFGSLY